MPARRQRVRRGARQKITGDELERTEAAEERACWDVLAEGDELALGVPGDRALTGQPQLAGVVGPVAGGFQEGTDEQGAVQFLDRLGDQEAELGIPPGIAVEGVLRPQHDVRAWHVAAA
ncbi:hypothetical protein GCM10010469_01110 [Streptomyces labedae]|uniref:Uncharacterized protein n=1 Tax=Streptomyces labedae TaxID=285569 RepID=A0ABP6QRF3_9ACTN